MTSWAAHAAGLQATLLAAASHPALQPFRPPPSAFQSYAANLTPTLLAAARTPQVQAFRPIAPPTTNWSAYATRMQPVIQAAARTPQLAAYRPPFQPTMANFAARLRPMIEFASGAELAEARRPPSPAMREFARPLERTILGATRSNDLQAERPTSTSSMLRQSDQLADSLLAAAAVARTSMASADRVEVNSNAAMTQFARNLGAPLAAAATAIAARPKLQLREGGDFVLTAETIPFKLERPAPPEGGRRSYTRADNARFDEIWQRYNPEQPRSRFQRDHVRTPFSQTPAGADQYGRLRDATKNMSEGGGATRAENALRRQSPNWRDPMSNDYVRPLTTPAARVTTPPEGSISNVLRTVGSKLIGGATKLLGIGGEALIIHSVVRDLQWHQTMSDPKWGNTYTDTVGTTWYRSPYIPSTWYNTPNIPGA